MPNQKLLLILSFSLVFLIPSCTWGSGENTNLDSAQTVSSESSADNLSPEQAEEKAKEIAKENRATFSEAIANADASVCEKIASTDLKFACKQNAIFQSAIQKNDKSICALLETEKGIANCKNAVGQLN